MLRWLLPFFCSSALFAKELTLSKVFYGNPSRPLCERSWGAEISTELLVWQAYEEGLTYTLRDEDWSGFGSGGDAPSPSAVAIDANAKWAPAFRLGLSYGPSWTVQALWTYFNSHSKSVSRAVVSPPSTGLEGLWIPPNTFRQSVFAFAKFGWQLHCQFFDFELGKRYWTSALLLFRPYFGARAAIIDQTFDVKYGPRTLALNLPFDHVTAKNDFLGFGPRGGIESRWYFTKGWNLSMNTAASLLYGKFHTHYFYELPISPHLVYDVAMPFSSLTPTVQTTFGVGWEGCFCKNLLFFGAHLAYEVQYWWDQNQLCQSTASQSQSFLIRQSRDLALQGFNLHIELFF